MCIGSAASPPPAPAPPPIPVPDTTTATKTGISAQKKRQQAAGALGVTEATTLTSGAGLLGAAPSSAAKTLLGT